MDKLKAILNGGADKELGKTWFLGWGAVLLFVGVLPKGETPVISSDYAASNDEPVGFSTDSRY
ncbi:hypothetical protein Cp87MAT_0416 [Corynebacterium pseudotuberculosis]|nr:hypothetical protein CPTA_00926 [Corynebacterium pseudotuberculosis]AIG08663.1 hypothetical protein CPTB_00607 [Corynebacterium pseudotuberculosis]AIG10556.1 hypothetical protein CPTC_00268 [Corynebacterium pseudotuberculosis]ALF56962.1 hypothetical protein AN902_01960 [Corynebacterium pseudotuberculosis]ALU18980.1 hypothetical protein AK970_01950 [Corynebacterium pseudotuberculosis]